MRGNIPHNRQDEQINLEKSITFFVKFMHFE